VIEALRSHPLLADVAVSADLFAHATGDSAVVVNLVSGQRIVRDRMDAFDLVFNCYSASKKDAAELALTVREFLLESLPATAISGVMVADVRDGFGPFDAADLESGEQRFIYRASLFVYEL
jgi:hypothetical protein